MKKHFVYMSMAAIMMASCTTEDFVGNNENEGTLAPIEFSSETPNLTRAIGGEAASQLEYNFSVLGTKTKAAGTPVNVFAQTAYNAAGIADANLYDVWYGTTTNTTTTNTYTWEYVGAAGAKDLPAAGTFNLAAEQTIKYWDYGYDQYDFIAYSNTEDIPTAKFTNVTTSGFSVKATATQMAGLYIADKKVITSGDYKKKVEFTFRSAGAKVRLGIYETIPGYSVRNVTFRSAAATPNFANTTTNVKLDGSFISAPAEGLDFDVTFVDPAVEGSPAVVTPAAAVTPAKFYDFGAFLAANNNMGTEAVSPSYATNATGTNAYIHVLPNPDDYDVMTLYVDYELYNATTGETIQVTGAKAAVPSAYMKWQANYAYTYLFKITDNTNGYTGADPNKAGLYPIVFDAVTEATTEGNQGTITTVAAPAITTYAAGSVSEAGIAYTTANTIYVTVNTDGTLKELNLSNTSFFSVAAGTTEADLQVAGYPKTAMLEKITIGGTNETVGGVQFLANKYAKLTGLTAGTYAVQYYDGTATHYKVIIVAAP